MIRHDYVGVQSKTCRFTRLVKCVASDKFYFVSSKDRKPVTRNGSQVITRRVSRDHVHVGEGKKVSLKRLCAWFLPRFWDDARRSVWRSLKPEVEQNRLRLCRRTVR